MFLQRNLLEAPPSAAPPLERKLAPDSGRPDRQVRRDGHVPSRHRRFEEIGAEGLLSPVDETNQLIWRLADPDRAVLPHQGDMLVFKRRGTLPAGKTLFTGGMQ